MPSTTSAVATTTIPLAGGNVGVVVPAGRASDRGGSAAGRMDLIPASGNDRKIVIVEKELRAGVEFDAVEIDLREQLSAIRIHSASETSKSTVAVDGRKVLCTGNFRMDIPKFGGRICLRGRQVSIGCQYLVGEWDAFEPECVQIVESLSFVN